MNQSPSNIHDGAFDKNRNSNLKTLTIPAKMLTLLDWVQDVFLQMDKLQFLKFNYLHLKFKS